MIYLQDQSQEYGDAFLCNNVHAMPGDGSKPFGHALADKLVLQNVKARSA